MSRAETRGRRVAHEALFRLLVSASPRRASDIELPPSPRGLGSGGFGLGGVDPGRSLRYTSVMKTELDKIMSEAMDLPAPLRAFLAAKLIESLDVNGARELSNEWKQEIRRRCREIDEGTVHLVEAEEAFAKAYARLTS